jgi:hypothetical protein
MRPNSKDFLEFTEQQGLKLLPSQIQLAEALIDYRVLHFRGGYRSGRTTAVNAVQDYFSAEFPEYKNVGREV